MVNGKFVDDRNHRAGFERAKYYYNGNLVYIALWDAQNLQLNSGTCKIKGIFSPLLCTMDLNNYFRIPSSPELQIPPSSHL